MEKRKLDGRLKMCDIKIIEKALKIAWVKRIQDESQASWKIIPNQLFHKHGSLAFLTKCNFATSIPDLDEKLPTFYKKKKLKFLREKCTLLKHLVHSQIV